MDKNSTSDSSKQNPFFYGEPKSTFTLEDIKNSQRFMRKYLVGFQVKEAPIDQDQLIEKYYGLKQLQKFMSEYDIKAFESSNGQTKKVVKDSLNDVFLNEFKLDQLPLMDSDEEEKRESNKLLNKGDDYEIDDEDLKAMDICPSISDKEYVEQFRKNVVKIFNKERGRNEAKRANLSDTKNTLIENSVILNHQIFERPQDQNSKQYKVLGNVKAIIPLFRERLSLETDEESNKVKYKRGQKVPINEERVFGILTKKQVGHIPSVDICFTEDEENFIKDTYIFKSLVLKSGNKVFLDREKEIKKILELNDFSRESIEQDSIDQTFEVGTESQLQAFHEFLFSDLFRKEKPIDFNSRYEKDKLYTIVPLKATLIQNENNKERMVYEIDRELLQQVEQLKEQGYANCQVNVIDEIKGMGIDKLKDKCHFLNTHILVKQDKPHSCYHFLKILEDLKNMSAEAFAEAIKGKPEGLGCQTAYELLFNASTRFKSVHTFRDSVFTTNRENAEKIKHMPIMLLDPIKVISHHKFKYALEQCPKNPNKKQNYKKIYKEKNNLTTSQGKPIFSSFNIYRHYLTYEQWMRAAQLPWILSFFERALHCHQLISQLGNFIHPELVLWATSAQGIQTSKKSYQTLETYGDTILKLAATLIAYEILSTEKVANENEISNLKNAFVTNLYLFRVGEKLQLRKYMITNDPDPKIWAPPYSLHNKTHQHIKCTGKNIADCVESILGAFFMSNNLRKTLELISNINLIPLKQAKILEKFPDIDLTFNFLQDIDDYDFQMKDQVTDVFQKYLNLHPEITQNQRNKIFQLINPNNPVDNIAEICKEFPTNLNCYSLSDLQEFLIAKLLPVEQILNYEFKNKKLLLEAFTHINFKNYYKLEACYEQLEVLGDAILDYLANANLIKYTILEQYNLKERLTQEYISQEDFAPFDAHQAKSLLTKNDFLAKLLCLFGLQKYILFYRPPAISDDDSDQIRGQEGNILEDWQKKRKLKEMQNDKEIDKYVSFSFRKNFNINGREIQLYEPSKVLGDVFESLIGAIFIDGGIQKVIEVYEPLLSPFILFTAKFSKKLYKEPKEEFMIRANLLKIKPQRECEEKKHVPIKILQKEVKMNLEGFDSNETLEMCRVDWVLNNREVRIPGYGNTRKQAERNASINGQKWLKQNYKQLEGCSSL